MIAPNPGPDEVAWRLFAQINSGADAWDSATGTHSWRDPLSLDTLPDEERTLLEHWNVQAMLTSLSTVQDEGRLLQVLREEASGSSLSPSPKYNATLAGQIVNADLQSSDRRIGHFDKGTIRFGPGGIAIKVMRGSTSGLAGPHYFSPGTGDYGVVAIHLTAATDPKRIWATWEQTDAADSSLKAARQAGKPNPDLWCCRDSFGWDPATNGPTQALRDLMEEKKVPDVRWRYYRLVGTQVDAVDEQGRPTHLGNQFVESKGLEHASCITCHAQAAFDRRGVGGPLRIVEGEPQPKWFLDASGKLAYRQIDFLWALVGFSEIKEDLERHHITEQELE